ncbi:MAG: hypothetical protein A3D92_03260 [Bacteroidetes bacterium RIFCSPHIGHO2_02_FULL_44_7]|nr:MAG: hypothetical protein A3D92_03260 [Bacteroidetes bacterium RIFCSPHIGHO2_02_FULL_44_7]
MNSIENQSPSKLTLAYACSRMFERAGFYFDSRSLRCLMESSYQSSAKLKSDKFVHFLFKLSFNFKSCCTAKKVLAVKQDDTTTETTTEKIST